MLSNVTNISPSALVNEAAARLHQRFRFVTLTCVDAGDNFEITYHFDQNYTLSHLRLRLPKGETLPSISHIYLAAVIVENEIKDLFGINVAGMAIDYGGKLLLSEGAPAAPFAKPAGPGWQEIA